MPAHKTAFFTENLSFVIIILLSASCNKTSQRFSYESVKGVHQVAVFEDSTFVEIVESKDSVYKLLGYWEGQATEGETLKLTITRKDFNVLTNIAAQHFLVKDEKLIPLDSLPEFKKLRDRTIYDKDGELTH